MCNQGEAGLVQLNEEILENQAKECKPYVLVNEVMVPQWVQEFYCPPQVPGKKSRRFKLSTRLGRHHPWPQTSDFFHGTTGQEGMGGKAQCLTPGRQSRNTCTVNA